MDLSERLARLTPEQRAKLESRLRERGEGAKTRTDAVAKRPASKAPLLSFAQERLWFLDQLEGSSATYNICIAHRLRGSFDANILELALMEIVRRHESLRTNFPPAAVNQPPIQYVHGATDFRLDIVDLSSTAVEQKESLAKTRLTELVCRPMSLARGPLFFAQLIRLDANNHILLLSAHHIIADGWSVEILFRELTVLYSDFISQRPPSLPALTIQYADFAYWQRQYLQGDNLQRVLDYWKKRLSGIPPLLELPTDFPRPAEQTYRGAYGERWAGTALTKKLHDLGRKSDATLFMIVVAAFQALLHRYSGQTDIVVGSPMTSRSRGELEPLIGFFVNMLPLRADFSSAPKVEELIQQVRITTLEALSHQELPFEMLVRELRPERNLSHAPLFQVALMFQQDDRQLLKLPGVVAEAISTFTDTAKFDLTLFVSDTKDNLRLWLEYSTDLFLPETANRLLVHLECLMESMVANPLARISDLNLLPEAERTQILVEWNRTGSDYPSEKTIDALFTDQVAQTPTSIAIQFERQALTYRELDQKAESLAYELRIKGIGVETPVGVYVERSIDMVVALLAILKAGGSYIPLDPAFPTERLAFMVSDAQVRVLVTQSRLAADLPEHQAEVIHIDKVPDRSPQASSRGARAENIAYILYTSGSTGNPKGVQISHRAVGNFLHAMRHMPGLRADDTLLAITTLSFDIAGLELFLPLTTGAKVVIASREDAVDPQRLAKLIKTSATTVMQATPATWRMLLDWGWKGDGSLKILCGGESIDAELAGRLLDSSRELWNMYGPTETTIWSTTERLLRGKPITIGRPIANTTTYILDGDRQPTPPGVVGELYIGGHGVARGYLNRPELTREKFIPDPFDKTGEARLYKTGDLARYRPDGRIVFLGRTDHQIKIRGFRIELGEIENALTAINGVTQAVVTMREDLPGQKRLVAYIVANAAAAASPDNNNDSHLFGATAVRAALRKNLPDYMVPTAYVFLDALPLTPNCKVDRKALPAPDQSMQSERRYEPAQGSTEEKLAGIMAALLQISTVGRKDDFFELGGHSILAVAFFSEIERVFGKHIPLATLFRAPTVEGLAAILNSDREPIRKWASLVPIQPQADSPHFFCVHGAGGNVLLYRDLVRALGKNYSFYGLQSHGLDKQATPLRTIEEMAEKYLEEIREVQRNGPYCLGGYCLGGIIAYEMAQRLRQAGQEVTLLALFDTYYSFGVKEGNPFSYLWQKIAFHSGNLSALSWKDLPGYVSSKIRVASDGEFSALVRVLVPSFHRKDAPHGPKTAEAKVQKINDAAAAAYRPKSYAGDVLIFKPKVNYDFLPDPQMGWGNIVTGKLEIIELPVNPHAMLVEPFVKHLADQLRQRIDGAKNAKTLSETTPVELHS